MPRLSSRRLSRLVGASEAGSARTMPGTLGQRHRPGSPRPPFGRSRTARRTRGCGRGRRRIDRPAASPAQVRARSCSGSSVPTPSRVGNVGSGARRAASGSRVQSADQRGQRPHVVRRQRRDGARDPGRLRMFRGSARRPTARSIASTDRCPAAAADRRCRRAPAAAAAPAPPPARRTRAAAGPPASTRSRRRRPATVASASPGPPPAPRPSSDRRHADRRPSSPAGRLPARGVAPPTVPAQIEAHHRPPGRPQRPDPTRTAAS